jgi:glycosyltransferase involved in cell wall biosynthesis
LNRYGANTFDYLDWSTRFSLTHAKAIIGISEFTKNELKDIYKVSGDTVKVIYHGYASELFKVLDNDTRAEAVLASYGIQSPYVFYVGRLEKKKNIAALVEAFYLLKTRRPDLAHKLYLIGDASFGFDDIKYSIHGFGLQHDVVATGWVAEHDLPYIFSRAAAFVFPSNYEGFGIPLLQAMATGTPIAASRAASIPEVAGDAALLFDPSDPNDIANALISVLTDEDLRESLRSAGFKRVKEFNWEKCARETLSLMESLD